MKAIRSRLIHLKKFSIRGLFAVTAVTAVTVAICNYLDPLNQYRRTRSQTALVNAVQGRLVDGMDREQVVALLGEPIDFSVDSRLRKLRDGYIAMVRKVAPLNSMGFPDGFQETDEFLSFGCVDDSESNNIETLHFRDSKLVNFSTQWLYDEDDLIDEIR